MTDDGPDAAGVRPLSVATIASGLGAVLVVVGLFGAWISGGAGGVQVPVTRTTLAIAGAAGAPTSGRGPASVPETPADDPQLGSRAHRVTFDGRSGGLAPAAGVGAWAEVSGRWAQADGSAHLVAPGAVRSLVVLHLRQAPTAVQVTLERVADNAGLVVRYQDPQHYVMLVAVPEQHALWLARVDGDPVHPQLLLAVGGLPLADRTRVGVRVATDRLTVVVNGGVAGSVVDDRFATSGGIGLVAPGSFVSTPGSRRPRSAAFGPLLIG